MELWSCGVRAPQLRRPRVEFAARSRFQASSKERGACTPPPRTPHTSGTPPYAPHSQAAPSVPLLAQRFGSPALGCRSSTPGGARRRAATLGAARPGLGARGALHLRMISPFHILDLTFSGRHSRRLPSTEIYPPAHDPPPHRNHAKAPVALSKSGNISS